MQVCPIKYKLKPPGTKGLKLECDILVSTTAFKFNLRRYIEVEAITRVPFVDYVSGLTRFSDFQ